MSYVPQSLMSVRSPQSLSRLGWLCALLPFVTTHSSYLIAASLGHVEWCFPYWDACTSISATGRQMPEKAWFKVGMIASILLTVVFWLGIRNWLQDTEIAELRRPIQGMFILGVLAAIFLTLYTLALGEDGASFQRMRRIGVTLAFAFTFLAQLLCTHLYGQFARETSNPALNLVQQRLLTLLLCLLGVGMVSIMLEFMLAEDYDRYEDGFEWIMALMLNGWFAGSALFFTRLQKPPGTPSNPL